MISEKRFIRMIQSEELGPGGWKCACCTPAPKGPKRVKFMRKKKRGSEKVFFRKFIEESLND
jgi:hypothetical protein